MKGYKPVELVPCPYQCEECPFEDCVAYTAGENVAQIPKTKLEHLNDPKKPKRKPVEHRQVFEPPITGAEFRLLRTNRGISLTKVKMDTGAPTTTVSSWENGHRNLSRKTYAKLASVYAWMPKMTEEV